jgi:enoyl-CoA hydratase
MACHFRIASDNARMGLPEVSLGVIPIWRNATPQLIGKGRAMEMIMTAGMVTADEAYRTGVNHVVPQVELLNSVMEAQIMRNSPWRSAKLSSQLMLIIKTVKMALKQK